MQKNSAMITIALEGMRFHAKVGWYEEEKLLGNELVVDVYLNVPPFKVETDLLPKTVDYETVFDTVKQVLSDDINLLETVCFRIIENVAALSYEIKGIQVRVSKLHPPVNGRADRVFVEQEWLRDNE